MHWLITQRCPFLDKNWWWRKQGIDEQVTALLRHPNVQTHQSRGHWRPRNLVLTARVCNQAWAQLHIKGPPPPHLSLFICLLCCCHPTLAAAAAATVWAAAPLHHLHLVVAAGTAAAAAGTRLWCFRATQLLVPTTVMDRDLRDFQGGGGSECALVCKARCILHSQNPKTQGVWWTGALWACYVSVNWTLKHKFLTTGNAFFFSIGIYLKHFVTGKIRPQIKPFLVLQEASCGALFNILSIIFHQQFSIDVLQRLDAWLSICRAPSLTNNYPLSLLFTEIPHKYLTPPFSKHSPHHGTPSKTVSYAARSKKPVRAAVK